MFRFRMVAITTVLALSACATTQQHVDGEIQNVDIPSLNTEATAEIGETLVAKGRSYVYEGLELHERVTDNGIVREYVVEPNTMRLIRTDAEGHRYYEPSPGAYYVNDKTFGKRAVPSNGYVVLRPNGTIYLTGYYDLSAAGDPSPANPGMRYGKVIDKGRPYFRQELIYGGRVNSQIRITYRELSNDRIRSGFTQEAQYDIEADRIIGFKGARIEVIEASNTEIRYKVIKSFPDSL